METKLQMATILSRSRGRFSIKTGVRIACTLSILLLTSCAQEMMNQRRVESQEGTNAYTDGMGSRRLPENAIQAGTKAMRSVSVGQVPMETLAFNEDLAKNEGGYRNGKTDGKLVDAVPKAVLENYDYRQLILRGQDRFNIFCAPCHDRTGSGNGMVARRGFKYPPSYHTDRLRQKPLGYLFSVATHGRGQMAGYGDFLSTNDRWAVAAYVRTLQFSQYATDKELSESDRAKLSTSAKVPSQATGEREETP